jgi:predicted RNA-binding Zn-ribbon protein involved in translation (DUF1610 family)
MTHALCPSCRLRFTPAAAAYREACPVCGEPALTGAAAEAAVGCRLFTEADLVELSPLEAPAALSLPDPRDHPS